MRRPIVSRKAKLVSPLFSLPLHLTLDINFEAVLFYSDQFSLERDYEVSVPFLVFIAERCDPETF